MACPLVMARLVRATGSDVPLPVARTAAGHDSKEMSDHSIYLTRTEVHIQ